MHPEDRAREALQSAAVGLCAALVRAEEARDAVYPLVARALKEAEAPDPYLSTAGQVKSRPRLPQQPEVHLHSERGDLLPVPENAGENDDS